MDRRKQEDYVNKIEVLLSCCLLHIEAVWMEKLFLKLMHTLLFAI